MRRILVIGSSGAGKSTLARRLAQDLELPLIHLDREYWRPGWIEPPRAEWRARAKELAAEPDWIMDGNFSSTWDIRVPRANAVIWLDVPRPVCLASVVRRVLRNWGRARPDLGPDCVERFDWSFMRWIWRYPKDVRPKTVEMLRGLRPDQRAFVLRSRTAIPSLAAELRGMPRRSA